MKRLPLRPGGLYRRMTTGMLLTALVTHIIVASLIVVAFNYHSHTVSSTDARGRLREARTRIEYDALLLDESTLGFSEHDGVYGNTVTGAPDGAFVASVFEPWASSLAEGTTAVWLTADGSVLGSRGDWYAVSALVGLAGSLDEGTGALNIQETPTLAAFHAIRESLNAPIVGWIAVSRPIVAADLTKLDPSASVSPPPATALADDTGWHRVGEEEPGYQSAFIRVTNADYALHATFLGLNGQPAFVLQSTQKNPILGNVTVVEFLLLGLLFLFGVLLVSQVQGKSVATGVNRPLSLSIQHLREQGERVLRGEMPDTDSQVEGDVPDEFKMLGDTVNELMGRLRESQAALIEARERAVSRERAFGTVVEESAEMKILVRGDMIELANPAATRYFGLRTGDQVADIVCPPEMHLADEHNTVITPEDLFVLASERATVVRVVGIDNTERWLEFHITHISPADDAPHAASAEEHYVVSARDTTEERRVEALREEVLSLVSHDLRSPLTVVLGYLDILGRVTEDERGKAAVENARRAAWRIEELLRDLASATRAVGVLAPGVMRPVDLADLAANVASALQVETEQTIVLNAVEGACVLGDSARLEQAVTNLVGNAIKHGPAHGSIDITVARVGDRAVLSVEDEGPGVPEEQRETIFERSARGSGSERTPGMGLGLYIVRVVAEAHGGLAYVDGTKDNTRFVLDLPLADVDGEAG